MFYITTAPIDSSFIAVTDPLLDISWQPVNAFDRCNGQYIRI